MAVIGATEISAAQQALVSNVVLETLKEKSMLLPTISDYSGQADASASKISIPRVNQLSAADKSENVALTSQAMTVSVDDLTFDKHKAIFVELEDRARFSAVDIEAEILKEQARELALQVDKDILFGLKSVSSSAPDHLLDYTDASGNVLALEDILVARQKLREAQFDFSDDNYFLIISPEKEKEMLSISNFIKANEYGNSNPLLRAEIGRVFGMRVMVNHLLAADEVVAYHKSHVAYAAQAAPKAERDRNLANLADQFSIQMLYGVKTLRGGVGGVFFNGTGS